MRNSWNSRNWEARVIMKVRKCVMSYEDTEMTPAGYAEAVVGYIGPKIIDILTSEETIKGFGLELYCSEAERDESIRLFTDKLSEWLKAQMLPDCDQHYVIVDQSGIESVEFETVIEKPE